MPSTIERNSQATGVVIDQAALVGLISRLYGLWIALISIRQIKTIENLQVMVLSPHDHCNRTCQSKYRLGDVITREYRFW